LLSAAKISATCEPINPAPPVISIFIWTPPKGLDIFV
jgi:hypothetical protein